MAQDQLDALRLQLSHAFQILEFMEQEFEELGEAECARATAHREDNVESDWERLVRKLCDIALTADETLQRASRKAAPH